MQEPRQEPKKMRRVTVAAKIERANERRAVFTWAQQVANGDCFMRGEVVHMEYTEKPYDGAAGKKYDAILKYFEQYPDKVVAEDTI